MAGEKDYITNGPDNPPHFPFRISGKDDMDIDAWLDNFVTKLEKLGPDKFGISPAEMAQLKADAATWHSAYDKYLKAQIVFRKWRQSLETYKQHCNDAFQRYKDAQGSGAGDVLGPGHPVYDMHIMWKNDIKNSEQELEAYEHYYKDAFQKFKDEHGINE